MGRSGRSSWPTSATSTLLLLAGYNLGLASSFRTEVGSPPLTTASTRCRRPSLSKPPFGGCAQVAETAILSFGDGTRSCTAALSLFRKKSGGDGAAAEASTTATSKLSPRQLRKLVKHPLYQAGQTFNAASVQSMGMLFYNVGGMEHKIIQSYLLAAGTHLVSASGAWDSNWRATKQQLAEASCVFADISDTFGSAQIDDAESLATLFEAVGLEFDDMSKIEKRTKTSENLFSIRDHLASVADILQENCVAETDDHDMILSFVSASESFGRLGEKYS